MSGPYFESGYIDINYFEGDGVTQSADATLTSSASVTVSGSITRQGDSTLTVSTTHSTEIQRNRFTEVSITDAFNASVSVSISKNLFSTLNSQFDWSVTASKIASNQSTLDAIIALSLQGVRQRDLVSTTLSSSFTLTTQIERIQTAQSTQNTAFTVTAQIDKILNAQSDQSSAFTLTTNTTKILNAQSDQSSAVTVTAQIDKILNAQSSVTVTSTITATVSKIISGNVNLTDAFASTFTVVVTKNHTADLNSAFSISVQAIKTGSNTITLNSEFNTTTTANRTRSTTVTITAEITHSTQSDRIRLFAVTVSSDVNVAVTIGKIVQASATINSAFEPTLTVTVFRNHTASLNAEFTIQITAQKFGSNIIDLTSAFDITAGVDRIRLFTIAIESNHSLNGVISLIKQGNFEQSATFTVQASTGTIKQSEIALSDVFNAQLAVIVFRNHTAALSSVTEISAVGTVTRSADISATSTTTVSATVTIISDVTVQMNVASTQVTEGTPTKNFVVSVNVLTEFSTVITRIQSAEISIQDAFVAQFTVTANRNNTITAAVTITQSTVANKIARVISTISTVSTVSVTAQKIKLATVTINAIAQFGRLGDVRTAKTITTVGNAQISTAQSKFGGSSVVFDGSGDKLTLSSNSDFAMGTGDFSIEFFVYITSTGTLRRLFDFRSTAANEIAPEIILSTTNQIQYRVDGTNRIGGALTVLAQNQWHHIAVARVSGSTRMYINGASTLTVYSDSNDYVQGGISIGGVVGDTGNFAGYLDEIRIIKGTSLYSGGIITVPTESLKNYSFADTKLLIHADGANGSVNITDDVQGFVENAEAKRTASAQANIQDAFVAQMSINNVQNNTANLTTTTEFTVLGTRVRLLNQGIGAVSTLVTQVDRIVSITLNLQSTVTTTGTIDRFRSGSAQFTDVFTAQMTVDVFVNSFSALSSEFLLTMNPDVVVQASITIQTAFTININSVNSLIATFNLGSNTSLNSVIVISVNADRIKQAVCQIVARFNRIVNVNAVIQPVIIQTLDFTRYPIIGTGIAFFPGNAYLELHNMPQIGTGDYTIEMLAHRSSLLFNETPNAESDLFNADFNFAGFGAPQAGPHIYIGDDDEIKAGNTYIFQGDQITSGGGEDRFFTDQTLHIALVRHNGSTRLYMDGIQKGTTLADTVTWTSTTWLIGAEFVGYIDEFRVSTVARYTGGNFGDIYNAGTTPFEFVKDSDTAVLLHFNNSLDEGLAQPEKTVNVNATLNTAFTVTAVLSNTRGVDILAFSNATLTTTTSNIIAFALSINTATQLQSVVNVSKNFASELFSNITTQVSVEKLKIINSAVAAEFNFAVDFVKFKNVQLIVGAECTAVIAVNVIRNSSVTVSDQFNVNVLGTRVRFALINLQSEFVTTVTGTETEGFAEPVTMTVAVNMQVSAESLRIIAVNVQVISTAVVNVSVLRSATVTMLVNAGKLSAIVVQRYAEISLISQVTLECVITKTTRYNAQLASAFANTTIIIRQRPGAAVMSVVSTMVVTAIKNISITKTLNAVFSITAEPQPLDQILVVLRVNAISTFIVSGIIVYIEKYELYVREEQRLLNIVSEERNIYITEENRVFTITDVEE